MPQDPGELAVMLSGRFQKREDNDVARIRRVLRLAEEPGCLTCHLLAYFGEKMGPCGHCGRCEGQKAQPLPPPRYTLPGFAEAHALRQLRAEKLAALAAPRQVARFLCGIASPATTRAKLRKHPMFGTLETVPFRDVLAFVESC
jgi:ATP-dependent DNA helicase RecQ